MLIIQEEMENAHAVCGVKCMCVCALTEDEHTEAHTYTRT